MWRQKLETGPTRDEPGPISSLRPHGVSSQQDIHEKLPFGVRSRDGLTAHGGEEGWEVVFGGRRIGGMFHGEVARERVREQLSMPRSRGRHV